MAKATRIAPKPVKQPPAKIILELSEGEADFILALTAVISGSPMNSPRKYNNRIADALTSAMDVDWGDTDAYGLLSGSIRFNDYNTSKPL